MTGFERIIVAMLEPLRSRVQLMVGRAILKVVDDAGAIQRVQMAALANELLEAERIQQYGFSSVPLQGAEAVFLAVGADRGHAVVVATDDRRYRPRDLKAGEVCLYNNRGAFIRLDKDGNVTTSAPVVTIVASDKVRIDAPRAEFTGDVVDNCDSNTVTVAQMRATYNLHIHPAPGGATSPPTQLMGA